MKTSFAIFLIIFFASTALHSQDQEFYKLKIYTFDSEEQSIRTDDFLKNHYLPAVKRQRIKNVGVFKNNPTEEDTMYRTYILIPSISISNLMNLDNGLMKDPNFVGRASSYLGSAFDNPPYNRIENVFLKAFEDMPVLKPSALSGPRKDRIYELRSYESATEKIFRNKVDMFNAGGEITLFEDLGFNAVFYAEVIAGSKMPNLMYLTTHANQEARDANWKSFRESPTWKEMKSLKKYQNNVSHIDIFFLYPTAYSDY